jgi:prepilin signal peptidase PulO-like enzyme (type II secretory pathway)
MILILILLGLCLGSFVNAFVYRLYEQDKHSYGLDKKPKKKTTSQSKVKGKVNLSIINGRSICVNCKHQLSAIDLIPLFSWIYLGGKCRYCKKAISWQYPLVELATAALFVFSYVYWPVDIVGVEKIVLFAFWLVYLVGFIALIIFDLRWLLLPNKIVYSLLAVFGLQMLYQALSGELSLRGLLSVILGSLTISGLFWLLFQLSSGKWIGGGDVKLAILLGALAGGLVEAFLLLFIASFLGSVIGGGVLLLSKKFNLKKQLPFGPYLIAATVIVVLFGGSMIDWYKNLFIL